MNKEDLLLEQWKMASELHRHEDKHSWQRFQYYITLTGILVSVLGVIWATTSINPGDKEVAIRIISAFGALTSLVFALIFKRSSMYHLYRIAQAKEAEEALKMNNERVLTLYEKELREQKLVRVCILGRIPTSNLVFYLTIIMTLCWALLLLYSVICNVTS